MNPLIHKQFETLNHGLEDLKDVLEGRRQRITHEREKNETLIKEHWSRSKENITLKSMVKDYGELQDSNERFKSERHQLQEHLRKILVLTRAISEELRP